MNIHYLPCNVRNEMVTKKNYVFRVYACQWLGPSITGKLYEKNGAMLHYIKVLLWTPAECMQRGTIKRRRKKEKMDVLLLFSNECCLQKMSENLEESNFLLVKMHPFNYPRYPN